ncbi:MAG: hypothetical protein U9Q66_02960 [Patescibacteria group bacterium]|nr:hypothetical protein [Patescibacteria group bacterium]
MCQADHTHTDLNSLYFHPQFSFFALKAISQKSSIFVDSVSNNQT